MDEDWHVVSHSDVDGILQRRDLQIVQIIVSSAVQRIVERQGVRLVLLSPKQETKQAVFVFPVYFCFDGISPFRSPQFDYNAGRKS